MVDAAICFHAICPEFAPPIYPGGCVIFRSCGWEFYREATDGTDIQGLNTKSKPIISYHTDSFTDDPVDGRWIGPPDDMRGLPALECG